MENSIVIFILVISLIIHRIEINRLKVRIQNIEQKCINSKTQN